MKHLGTKRLETNRLILRPFLISDVHDMYKNWASDDRVTKYVTWPTHSSVEITKDVISSWIKEYSNDNYYQWCIVLKNTNELIGSIAVVHMDERVDEVEIGYCLGYEYWNNGYMTEAFARIIQYFFEEVKVKRISAVYIIDNVGSGKVMEKCGLKYEGTLRNKAIIKNGELKDLVCFGIIIDDYNRK